MSSTPCTSCQSSDYSSHHESRIRFLHNVVGAPTVDILLGSEVIARNLAYEQFTSYLKTESRRDRLTVRLSGTTTVVASATVNLKRSQSYTVIVAGLLSDLSTITALVYTDDLNCPVPGFGHLRFIHAAAGAPAVDVYVRDVKVFSNVSYTQTGVPAYAPVRVGEVTQVPGSNPVYIPVTVKLAGTSTIVVGPAELYIISGGIYTIVATGLVGVPGGSLSAIVSQDNPDACDVLQSNFRAQAYMGKWYQIANIPQFFDANCARSTAEYTLLQDSITVFNSCIDTEGKVVSTITGSAVATNPCVPAALKVTFPPFPPFPPVVEPPGPNYLIHKTNYSGYAVVGSPTRTTLYILSRKPQMCYSEYKKLRDYARRLGYDVSRLKVNYKTLNKC
jgi:apolipoprotein D and lipocalin family protein